MNELAIRPSDLDIPDILIGELVDDSPEVDGYDEIGPCRGDGGPCDDYRCCIP